MEFESSHEAARRLRVNVRTIQKWAKEGKIPGAKRMGKSWLIPLDFKGPGDEVPRHISIMPLLNHPFSPGHCQQEIEALTDDVEKAIAYGEYYYFSGQPSKAVNQVEPYLYHPDGRVALSAGVIYVFASLSLGEIGQRIHAMQDKLQDINQRMIAVMHTLELGDFATTAALFQNAVAVMMNVPLPLEGGMKENLRYLPEGLRLFGAYTIAHNLYLHHEYERALGVAETALMMIGGGYPVARIYLKLMVATTLMELRRVEAAKAVFMEAWALAKPDGLIEPFAEHYALLHGLAEVCLKRRDPEGFQQIISATRRFSKGWAVYHEKATQQVLADNLTSTEFSIAMMYNKGWTIKEIAAHLEMSERMVKHHISIIYEKLDVSSRDELKEYMPNR